MKKPATSKSKPSWSVPPPLSVPRNQTQVAALRILTRALNDQDDGRVVGRLMSIGLYVLGVDPAGDYCLDELTDALYGKGSKESMKVSQDIADAAGETQIAWENVERNRRARELAEGRAA
jgi:hypothetical protein